ncbi:MAG: HAD-IC family P-type ATPase, partial [Candidatus Aquicultor sp.]
MSASPNSFGFSIDQGPTSSERPNITTQGLSSEEARRRLARYGPNEVIEERKNPTIVFLGKLWTPVPWMLEAAIILTWLLGRTLDTIIIAFLLIFNVAVSFYQENRASNVLELLKQRLAVNARVNRDGKWSVLPARELVPGDLVHIRLGDIVPADLSVGEGQVMLDQSSITGESLPAEAGKGAKAYSGSVVVRGEVSGIVTATGSRTFSGKTAQLVQEAQPVSHLQMIIMGIVRYLIIFDAALVALLLGYTLLARVPLGDALPFALILLIASVPAALPATFTVATAIGALQLAHKGILVTRLNAIEEAAALDVACLDKTGTITRNKLSVVDPKGYGRFTPEMVLQLAAYASDPATQDPIDLAVLTGCKDRGITVDMSARVSFTPFDPATKRTEAVIREGGTLLRVIKGAPQIILQQVTGLDTSEVNKNIEAFAKQGLRIIAVAIRPAGEEGKPGGGKEDDTLTLAGILPLEDPPRKDSAALVQRLTELGNSIKMLTGDSA